MSEILEPSGRRCVSPIEYARLTGTGIATVRRYLRARLIPFHQPKGRKGRVLIPLDAAFPTAAPPLVVTPAPTVIPAATPTQSRIPGRKPRWFEE